MPATAASRAAHRNKWWRIPLRPALILSTLALLATAESASARAFEFDRVHSQVSFEVSHLGFSMSQGRFKGLNGQFEFNPKHWDRSTCDVRIDVASLDMGDAAWSKKLLGKDWFDVQQHPEMHFVCSRLEQIDATHGKLQGELTLLGNTRAVTLDLTLNRIGMHKFALAYVAGFGASTSLRRSDFGMAQSIPDVGDEVGIRIQIEGKRRKD
jgi:polyisoprenoid-binding protein YceI